MQRVKKREVRYMRDVYGNDHMYICTTYENELDGSMRESRRVMTQRESADRAYHDTVNRSSMRKIFEAIDDYMDSNQW